MKERQEERRSRGDNECEQEQTSLSVLSIGTNGVSGVIS